MSRRVCPFEPMSGCEGDCNPCLPFPERETDPAQETGHRIGTCYEDPDTGEYVMPADFAGDRELRWMPDGHGNNPEQGPPIVNVPALNLEQQQAIFEERLPMVLTRIRSLVDNESWMGEAAAMARERLATGYDSYGDTMYRWQPSDRRRELLEELADALVYLSSGPI